MKQDDGRAGVSTPGKVQTTPEAEMPQGGTSAYITAVPRSHTFNKLLSQVLRSDVSLLRAAAL